MGDRNLPSTNIINILDYKLGGKFKMIARIELSNGDSFSKIIDVQEYIDNSVTNITTVANIIIGKNSDGTLPDIIEINSKFSIQTSLDTIKIYLKDNEEMVEYLGFTLNGYSKVRSISKSYNYNSVSVSLGKG